MIKNVEDCKVDDANDDMPLYSQYMSVQYTRDRVL